ncbi:MAG: hypothetical protein J6T41_05085, partial [Neisseriaceae bacterium]|nr:hypothetical protein [Neisseriaceae bacterium]
RDLNEVQIVVIQFCLTAKHRLPRFGLRDCHATSLARSNISIGDKSPTANRCLAMTLVLLSGCLKDLIYTNNKEIATP